MAADYTAVPISIWDGTAANTDIFARANYIFDAPLSFEKLHAAWIEVLRARPITQARVRRSKTAPSGLEYHVYTPEGLERYLERQSTAPDHLKDFFCLDQSKRSFTEYSPALNRSAEGSRGIFVADAPHPEDDKRCTYYNAVGSFDELLNSDRPILTTQVTRFNDATIISYTFNHLMGDIFAIKDTFNGLSDALYGKPIAPWKQLGEDPFADYGPGGKLAGEHANSSSPPLPAGWRIFGFFDKVRFLTRMLWDVKYARPESTMSPKYVFLPDTEINRLMQEARHDLIAVEEKRKKEGKPPKAPLNIGRSNVIYAWVLKHSHEHLGPEEISTPVTIANARGRPPTGMSPNPEEILPHNWWNGSYLASLPSLKVREIREMSLGELALLVREGTDASSSPESAQRIISFGLHNGAWKKPTGKLAFWSPPNHRWSGLTDWRAAGYGKVDLSPARLGGTGPVKLCTIHTSMIMNGTHRDRWACMGDAGGGTWVKGTATESDWRLPTGFGKYPHYQLPTKRATSIDEYRVPEEPL
ncbi:hypothetical protein N7452_006372 [Penicillium brevicompactum]|uniref:Uncharacterized protein n=1 Tax=Penicillium brevicompactum TaxID=5074 RepID=A0A9W9QNE1_PENBR|nr:hypothetical protein N7452_006372 [Penicillium brevicompactum]